MGKTKKQIICLLGINIVYASVSLASKYSSLQKPFSLRFFGGIACVVLILGLYAILWQQILKRIELSTAYMFKGSSLIFVLLLSAIFLGEGITLWNVIGAVVIAGGIVLFAKA